MVREEKRSEVGIETHRGCGRDGTLRSVSRTCRSWGPALPCTRARGGFRASKGWQRASDLSLVVGGAEPSLPSTRSWRRSRPINSRVTFRTACMNFAHFYCCCEWRRVANTDFSLVVTFSGKLFLECLIFEYIPVPGRMLFWFPDLVHPVVSRLCCCILLRSQDKHYLACGSVNCQVVNNNWAPIVGIIVPAKEFRIQHCCFEFS